MRIHICTLARTCAACACAIGSAGLTATRSRGTEGFRTVHETRADGIGQRQGRTLSRQSLTYALTASSTSHFLACGASATSVARRRAGRSKQAHEARGGARDLQVAPSDVMDAAHRRLPLSVCARQCVCERVCVCVSVRVARVCLARGNLTPSETPVGWSMGPWERGPHGPRTPALAHLGSLGSLLSVQLHLQSS